MLLLILAQTAAPQATLPPETRAQAEAHAVVMHRRLDLDRDGFVTYDEMLRVAMAWVVPTGAAFDPKTADTPAVRARFAAADLDHDGRISLAEAIKGADAAFDAQDTDHDGVLSGRERSAALGAMVEREKRDLDAMAAERGAKR